MIHPPVTDLHWILVAESDLLLIYILMKRLETINYDK